MGLGLLVVVLGVPEAALALSFDFEDGLQGWTAGTNVERRATSLLGGGFAVFGQARSDLDDFDLENPASLLRIELDLAPFDRLEWSQIRIDDQPRGGLRISISELGAGPGPVFIPSPTCGVSVVSGLPGCTAGLDRRTLDLSELSGLHVVSFLWTAANDQRPTGWVDDIVLSETAAPEASPLLQIAFGGLVLSIARGQRKTSLGLRRG